MLGNLPVMTTSFVGRDSELDTVRTALAQRRCVTLTGGGGVGKSRLALRVAEQIRGQYADGVWWVDLSNLYDDRLFTATVCDAVDLLDHNPRAPVEALCEWLTGRQILLVFDCCERVLASCLLLMSELLAAAPQLTILATSRQAIGVRIEHRIEVAPLSMDDGDDTGNGDAVRLFRERCATTAPALSLDSPARPKPSPPSAIAWRNPARGRTRLCAAAGEQSHGDRRTSRLPAGHARGRDGVAQTAPGAAYGDRLEP